MPSPMARIGGLTLKQAAILFALGDYGVGHHGMHVREIVSDIHLNGGGIKGWVGRDPEGMRQTLTRLALRGLVVRHEVKRVRDEDFQFFWSITDAGHAALSEHIEAIEALEFPESA